MPEPGRGLRHVEHAMGTVFSLDVRDPATPALRTAVTRAVAWLHHADGVFSTYRPDSVVSRLGRGEITYRQCSREVREVLDLCAEAEEVTGGWFSTTAGAVLDPSGLVKGWAIERVSDLLHAAGARNTCVNGGGDLQLRGEAAPGVPWRVGIAHPLRPGAVAAVVTGRDLAVATSGTAERGPHILDPHTGEPASGCASVTVVGRHLTTTDAYATAAFAMGPSAALAWVASLDGHEALTIDTTGRTDRTPGFPGTDA
ncbi:FAD:protein FMN transferase [Streptomyces blastmyceticus]|uniref:FAD:protein FMN transferase n=1 Tax=Streptomyces blastmyceticus TaxID=68180 RepID=A0ABN0X5N1_9ACTN